MKKDVIKAIIVGVAMAVFAAMNGGGSQNPFPFTRSWWEWARMAEAYGADFDPMPSRGQISSKVLGFTTYAGCPTQDIVDTIKAKGQSLGADYTEILQVTGASLCPATLWGIVHPYIVTDVDGNFTTTQVGLGVTLGVHYKVQRE